MEIENIKNENVTSEMEHEPMDTNETSLGGLAEEGEISGSDDESAVGKQTKSNTFAVLDRNSSRNQSGGFVTGFNIFDKDEAIKKIDRAKRFSIPIDSENTPQIHTEELAKLHKELGIEKDNEKNYRFNAIHMRGTDDMSTEDVFQYFECFAPSHVEWINDKTCNVVWLDDISAARALLKLSKRIRNLDKIRLNANPFEKELKVTKESEEDMDGDDDDDESVDARKITTAIPPGCWRLGNPAPKALFILLRYASKCDKKQQNAERNSEYYKKYGNPHYGNRPGVFSNSLRIKKFNFKKPKGWNKKIGGVVDKKNPWKDIAYTWGKIDRIELDMFQDTDSSFNKGNKSSQNDKSQPDSPNSEKSNIPDLRLSLENKKENRKRVKDGGTVDTSMKHWRSKMKVPRMKMHADDEEKRSSNYLNKASVIDLRGKIDEKKSKHKYKFATEKKRKIDYSESESSNGRSEYDDDDDDDVSLNDDELGTWASQYLENAVDKDKKRSDDSQSVSEKRESDGEGDRYTKSAHWNLHNGGSYKRYMRHRSPLQIEIDNDEYYQNK